MYGEAGGKENNKPLIVAHSDNTEIYINGDNSSGTLVATLNAGEDYEIDNEDFSDESLGTGLYVYTSEKVFAYQSISGGGCPNSGLFLSPHLDVSTPNEIDNIPAVKSIGSKEYDEGVVLILTKVGADVKLNNAHISTLNPVGPLNVSGNVDYITYAVSNLSGNLKIESDKELYVAVFGRNGAASFGGYYSGFDTKPIVSGYDNSNGTVCASASNPVTLEADKKVDWFKRDTQTNSWVEVASDTDSYNVIGQGEYRAQNDAADPSCDESISETLPLSIVSMHQIETEMAL